MAKVLDDALLIRAACGAELALAAGDPDTLAGRFNPALSPTKAAELPERKAEGDK